MTEEILWIVSFAIFVFFVVYIIATFALIGMSLVETTLTKIERGEVFSPPLRLRRPGISLVAPAYNTEPLIVASVRSLLASDYEPLEVVIVDDGSDDGTSEKLIAAFDLIELPVGDRLLIPSEPIHQVTRPHTQISYAADANAWTEVPTGMAPLRGQRIRWHVGLLDNLRIHQQMLCRRRYGAVGLLALPYTVAFEVGGPIIQIAGYAILIAMILLGLASWWYVAAFLLVTVLVGQLQTAGAILVEEVGFHRYRERDLMMIAGWSLLELFWYRPITAVWRTWATVLVVVGRRPGWGSIPRGTALGHEGEAEITPTPLPR